MKKLLLIVIALFLFIKGYSQTPVINFTFPSDTINAWDVVTFTNVSTGFNATTVFHWTYGDFCSNDSLIGAAIITNCSDSTIGSTTNSIHQYIGSGEFTITLKAKDGLGIEYSIQKQLFSKTPTVPLTPVCELVTNGMFETFNSCPISYGFGITGPIMPWFNPSNSVSGNPNGTPDYFLTNSCTTLSPFVNNKVPNNKVGCQPDLAGGYAYTGIVTYFQTPSSAEPATPPNYREYISQQLASPMVANQNYNVTFSISLAEMSAFATKPPSVYFTNTTPSYNGPLVMPSINTNRLDFQTMAIITDKTNWVTITGIYTAVGGERFITIGNFFNDVNTQISSTSKIACHTGVTNPSANFSFYYIDGVSVIPQTPTILASASPNSICLGNFSNLTASGASTYSWDNGSTTNPTVVSPTATTTYTVTGTFPNGCTSTASVLVTVNPNPNVTVNSPSICSGSNASLTANGATSYSWSTGQTTNPISVAPTSTTTYTVTGTLNGCTNTAVSTVTVNSISATASATPSTINAGQSSNLNTIPTGGTGYTYSWSPSGNLSSSTIQNPVATPTVTTTYTVTITDSRGCITTATTIVTVLPPQCSVTLNRDIANGTLLSSLWPANSMVTAQNIRITGTVYADVNVTFANCNIIMQPNAKIQLQNSTILKLTEKTHVYSCTELWDGIYASTTTQKIIVEQNAFIEDAQNAIVSENGGQYDLSMCIFNKNKIGLDVRAYTNNSGSNYPGIVRKTLFTTRNIPSNQVPSSNLTMASILSNITSYPISNTKVPYQYQKGIYGVNITDVIGSFGINIGYAGLMPDGTSATNYFEGIHVGVNATRSTFKVYNNNFQNLVHASSTCIGCMNPVGAGVKAKGTNTGTYAAVVGFSGSYNNNTFYNCHRAVEISEYKSSYVGFNTIDNSVTASGLTPGYGNGGIYVLKPAAANSINIQYNNVNNCATGIWTGYNFSAYSVDTYTLQINNNTISANTNGYCTNAIYLNTYPTATITTPSTSEIKDNSITQATNGISISNFKKIINIKTNSISNRYAASGSINGIKLTGCQNLVVENNHTNYDVATASLINGNLAAYGIYLQNSSNMIVKCNTIEKAARSMVFEGTCTSSTTAGFGITRNTMIKAQDGFVLKGSGIIGQQGNSNTIKSDNVWDLTAGNYFTTSQTNVELGSDANLSKLYVTNLTSGLVTRPVLNSGGGSQYFWSTSLLSSTGTAAVCGFVPAALMAGGNENLSMSSSSSSNYSNELKAIEQDNTQFPVYNDESHWQRDKFVYDELVRNSNLTTNAALNNFYNNTTSAAIGKFNSVEKKMASGNYIVANTINNSINPSNLPEQNQKTMNTLILNQAINTSYVHTSSDIATATAIAEQCPLQGGNAVYQARNLLMIINNDVIEFVDNCDAGARTMLTNENTTAAFDDQSFKLYPNPNDGNMVLSYSLAEKLEGTFNLYDITGRLINKYTLTEGENNSLKITESNLTSGVYFYSIVINEEIKTYNKIVITK
jgi:hypothetical protein